MARFGRSAFKLLIPVTAASITLGFATIARAAERVLPRFVVVFLLALFCSVGLGGRVDAGPTFVGPTPYRSAADIPVGFYAGGSPTALENLEDGTLDFGITVSGGAVSGPHFFTDSVDADDGAIDGSGSGGTSWFSNVSQLTFTFPEPVTAAALVLTDAESGAVVSFEAFGPGMVPLGGLGLISTADISQQTAGDRFLGVQDPDGVIALRVTTTIANGINIGIEVDHVQFGDRGQCVSPSAGMVSWWRAEGNAGDSVDGNHGVPHDNAGFAAGQVGDAFTFDGNGDNVTVAGSPSLNFGTADFSVEFWARFDAFEFNDTGLLSKDSYAGDFNNVNGWVFNQCDGCGGGVGGAGTGGIGFQTLNRVGGSGPWTNARYATANFQPDRWYHITGVRNAGVLYLYVDGVLRAATPEPSATNVSNSASMTIGSLSPASPQFFDGRLDEISIYDRALSAAEIQATYGAGVAGMCMDQDADSVPDGEDNCVSVPNTDQADLDEDGEGDACDADDDGDGVLDASDNCARDPNAGQDNNDGDADGDACDVDDDNDGVEDGDDNCSFTPNPDQLDSDGDGAGDSCDADLDGDGVPNVSDNCVASPNEFQENLDGDGDGDACDLDDENDGVADEVDNCPLTANSDQDDLDLDGIGDACDLDVDGDGEANVVDNCPLIANGEQTESDDDGDGDACDGDDDGDGVPDGEDNCSLVANSDQSDGDGDSAGDACDPDDDNDGFGDGDDNCVFVANSTQVDADNDGAGDACDPDDDNDGEIDGDDNCAVVANPSQSDADGDGLGDACDADLDGDGAANASDNCRADPNAGQEDADGDGTGDVCDTDLDGDGALNDDDNCPSVANASQSDHESDGLGDVCDDDDDNDNVADAYDNCELVANTSQTDGDGDGLGDACDVDDDEDGVANAVDLCPGTPLGVVVDPASGCSIAQLCPCAGPRGSTERWRNHGKYRSCIAKSSDTFLGLGLVTSAEHSAIGSDAGGSTCGK